MTQKTDRELMEMAAKAAGIGIMFWSGREVGRESPVVYPHGLEWCPLTDDGDALRLAVKLKLDVSIHEKWVGITCVGVTEEIAHDAEAATRRAIVRAAANIGWLI